MIETFQDTHFFYIVMENITGGDVCTWVRNYGRLYGDDLYRVFRGAVLGLQAIHEIGMAHGDISVENLLLDGDKPGKRDCKIIDLGLAFSLEEKKDQKCRGKEKYMAPEVYLSEPFDPMLADVFSLGVCLFIMATGTPPFQEQMDTFFRKFIINRKIRSQLKSWNINLSNSLLDLIEKMVCFETERISLDDVLSHKFLNP